MGFDHFRLAEFGGYSYIGITHLVLARNSGAIIIAGMPTVEPGEEWVIDVMEDKIIMTQDMANYLNSDGSISDEYLGIAGHGRR